MYGNISFDRVGADPAGTALGTDGSGQQFIYIRALSGNSDVVYLAKDNDAVGYPLAAGDQLGPLPYGKLSDVKVYGAITDYVAIVAVSY